MLAKCVLASPPRQGKAKKAQSEGLIRSRAQRWLNGERAALWEEISQGRRRKKSSMSQKDKFYLDRCLELARDGQFSKACQMLISRGIASSSASNIAAMREKHPSSMGEIDLTSMGPTPNRIAPEITSETVEKTIRSFRRGTAPGRTALRAQHLLDGLRSAHNDEILVHLTKLVILPSLAEHCLEPCCGDGAGKIFVCGGLLAMCLRITVNICFALVDSVLTVLSRFKKDPES